MFYCEPCRVSMDWPKNLRGYPDSHGPCEVCLTVDACYDVPSSALPSPPPVRKERRRRQKEAVRKAKRRKKEAQPALERVLKGQTPGATE